MRLSSNERLTLALLLVIGAFVTLAPAPAMAQSGPYSYYAVTPCRVVESGNPDPFYNQGGVVPGSVVWNVVIKGRCSIPTTAQAVSLNLTVALPTAPGFITLWPKGGAFPTVSTINFLAGEPAIANGAIVPVATVAAGQADLSIAYGAPTGNTTYIAIDVTGYFQ